MDETEKKSLPKNALKIYRIWLTIGMSAASFVAGMLASFDAGVGLLVVLLFLAIYGYLVLCYAAWRYNCERYVISQSLIYRQWGVFFPRESLLRADRVQFVKIIARPIPRMLGLYSVVFYGAGCCEKLHMVGPDDVQYVKKRFLVRQMRDLNEV